MIEQVPGERQCFGFDLYEFQVTYDPVYGVWGGWVLIESNSPTCGYTPPEPEPEPEPEPPPPEPPPPEPPVNLLMVSIFAPAEAEPGTTVNPSISVINKTAAGIKVLVACQLDGNWLSTTPTDPVVIPAYSQRYWYTSFTMPDYAATIHAQSMVETLPGEYEYDGSASKVITVSEVGPPPVAGTITDKWVNKAPEGSHLPIPAAVAPDGNTFEIGISGRNESDISIVAGMEVTVVDPEGVLRASPAIDWTGMNPGEELNWEYNISPVDKPGDWTTLIRFQAQE